MQTITGLRFCFPLLIAPWLLSGPAARPTLSWTRDNVRCRGDVIRAKYSRHVERALTNGGRQAQFRLTVSGKSPSSYVVDFCVSDSNGVLYEHQWSARHWSSEEARTTAGDPSRTDETDHAIITEVDSFFASSRFAGFALSGRDSLLGWVSDFDTPYAPVAYSLKQYAFRSREGLQPLLTLLSGEDSDRDALSMAVRDSLRMAPVDSTAVRLLIGRLAQHAALTFAYHVGGELWVEICWDDQTGRFLLTKG